MITIQRRSTQNQDQSGTFPCYLGSFLGGRTEWKKMGHFEKLYCTYLMFLKFKKASFHNHRVTF